LEQVWVSMLVSTQLGVGSEELQARVVPACLSMKIPRVTDHVILFRHQADRDMRGRWAEMPIELSPSWPALPMPPVLLCSEIGAVLKRRNRNPGGHHD
jgi:hypothetical protein